MCSLDEYTKDCNEYILRKTKETEINDETFRKFISVSKSTYFITKGMNLGYDFNLFINKNIIPLHLLYIDNNSIYSSLRKSYDISDYIPNNYVINKIVEWTISDDNFYTLTNNVKIDKKFTCSLYAATVFLISSKYFDDYNNAYILYIIYRLSIELDYKNIMYIIDISRSYLNINRHYKKLINNKFNEKIFSDEEIAKNTFPDYIDIAKKSILNTDINDINFNDMTIIGLFNILFNYFVLKNSPKINVLILTPKLFKKYLYSVNINFFRTYKEKLYITKELYRKICSLNIFDKPNHALQFLSPLSNNINTKVYKHYIIYFLDKYYKNLCCNCSYKRYLYEKRAYIPV